MEPVIHKMNLKGQFETSDATPTTSALENSIATMFSGEEGVIRVSCKVSAYNKASYGEDYYFGSETTYMYNQHGNNEFDQIDSSSDTTYSETATSALSFSLDDTDDVISMAYTGEAGEDFIWEYEAEIELFVGSLQDWLDLYLTFQIFDGRSGVANLDEDIEVNGTTVSPTFVYYGGDADGTNWIPRTGGQTLTLTATPVPTYNDGSPCLGTNDDSVKFNDGGFYDGTDNDVATEDFVIEVLFKHQADAGRYLISTYDGSTGYILYTNSDNARLYIEDSGGSSTLNTGAVLTPGCWYYLLAYVNRDEASVNGSFFYINGVAVGSGKDSSAVTGTLNTNEFQLGASYLGSAKSTCNLAYCSMWKYSDLFSAGAQGEAEAANLAASRFAQVSGRYPQVFTHDDVLIDGDMEASPIEVIVDGDCEAVGTGDWTATDATLSKDTTAPLNEGTQHLRITSTANTFWASQTILTVGKTYRVTGSARSAGSSAIPKINSVGTVWTGTTSTDWQDFNEIFVATGTVIYFGSSSTHPGIVDFDNIQVLEQDGDWTVTTATLSKDTTAPLYEGTQHLRLTYLSAFNGYAQQAIQIVGHKYRVTGVARSDGTGIPKISEIGATHWTGTTSTSWQPFDITYVALTTALRLQGGTLSAGVYVEFDDVTVTRVDELPIVATRAFAAYLDKIESDGTRKLYYVGSEWLRQCHRNDGTYDIYGYLAEAASTNQVDYSEDIDNVAWTPTQATFHATKIAAPNGVENAIGMVASSVAGNHAIQDSITSSAGTDTVSFWAKKGNQDWVLGYYGLGAAAQCYFDLDNGVVEGTPVNCIGYIEDWGDDWFRCIMVFTGDGAAHSFYVFCAENDGDTSFSGDDSTVSTYVWGVQYEQGRDYATSYIPTSGGVSTRLKDQLEFKGDDGNITNNQQGSIVANILHPDKTPIDAGWIYSLSDGAASADRIYGFTTSSEHYICSMLASVGNAGASAGTVDVFDGIIHTIRGRWEIDNLIGRTDETDATADIDCGVPDDIDKIAIGNNRLMTNQFGGLIENLRIYNIPTTKG